MFVFNDPGNHQGVVQYCSSGVTQAENCAAARGTEFAQNKMCASVFRINFSRVLQSEITDAGLLLRKNCVGALANYFPNFDPVRHAWRTSPLIKRKSQHART